ncbi:M23 family metallopeptidase [Desulfofundulus salinus]|uniref:M23 family metallopeptidase n=1 Tax=Desulfofundulus salinus TaxID=2419843 RepID=A0A494WSR0_9FIRM|nr:M23 family metallopeptidase [Desulfofundulus salinum]RKO66369.1 M23 family metallopeptidase [Desulfofundulus salinum]
MEAYTIRGHNLYRYRWVTKTYGDGGSVTYEELAGIETLDNGRKYLEAYLAKALGLPSGSTDIELAGDMVFNAGIAFTQARKEWLAWLDHAFGVTYAWASGAGIPAEFRTFLEEAEKLTGIPAWFLAGLIQKESDWNPLAVNDRTGCFGLTQQHPDYWPERARAAGFDPERDKWNPRAQIIVGALYLVSLFDARGLEWEGDGWKNDSDLHAALARYGGYGADVVGAKPYIDKVVTAAQAYRTPAVWPVPGTGRGDITSYFGMRYHPTLHIWRMHNGIDIAAPEGTPVVSVSGGVVTTGYDSESGNFVVVRDGTYEYVYCHLSRILAVDGQAVRPGDQIGLVGATGEATGPHLHFGVKKLNTNSWIDPLLVLS